jgi:hypothetical protein
VDDFQPLPATHRTNGEKKSRRRTSAPAVATSKRDARMKVIHHGRGGANLQVASSPRRQVGIRALCPVSRARARDALPPGKGPFFWARAVARQGLGA